MNLEKVVKISSNHLLIPALHLSISKNKILKDQLRYDFLAYLNKIYLINRNRNRLLLEESKNISSILKKNKIKHVFLKGAALISDKIYDCVGERMVGDIDILIQKTEKNKVIEILKKEGYNSEFYYKKWDANTVPNMVNKDRLFSLDLHLELFPKKYSKLMNSSRLLENHRQSKNKIPVLNIADQIMFTILNFQIHDYGYLRSNYSLKKSYDVFKLIKLNKKVDLKQSKLINCFLKVNLEIGLNLGGKDIKVNKLYINRFRLKKSNIYYKKIDSFFCNLIIKLDNFDKKIIEFIFNRDYRKKLFK